LTIKEVHEVLKDEIQTSIGSKVTN